MASRSLIVRLDVDRPDPENREFVHPDPFDWTLAHRGKILAALYTILLGNPHLGRGAGTRFKGRFKTWQRLVGAAVEHAAEVAGQPVDFSSMFLSSEADDDESANNADVPRALAVMAPDGQAFRSADVVAFLKAREGDEEAQTIRGFIDAQLQGAPAPKTITIKLKTIVDGPLFINGGVWILRSRNRPDAGVDFWIEKRGDGEPEIIL